MKSKMIFNIFISLFLAIGLFLPGTVYAEEITGNDDIQTGQENSERSSACNIIIDEPKEVYQEENNYKLKFRFAFEKEVIGETFAEGEKIILQTNIGELFEGNWNEDFKNLSIKNDEQIVIASADIEPDKITITITADGSGNSFVAGEIMTVSKLTAKNVGATEDSPVTKALKIGCASENVVFKQRKFTPGWEDSPVDIDIFWKN